MSDEQRLFRRLEIPGFRPLKFRDLPRLIASALHDGEYARAAAEITINAQLEARVDAGTFIVRNPLDLGPHTFPLGAQLKSAVIFPWELRPLCEERGIELVLINEQQGPDSWTIRKATEAIGRQEEWHRGAIDSFCERMMEAARSGALVVRDPTTDLPFHPETQREFYELVTPADVNRWLEKAGVGYRWKGLLDAEEEALPIELPPPTVGETVPERQDRRLARLRDLGGDVRRVSKGLWAQTRKSGALAKLVNEERAAGQPRWDSKDIRTELSAAAEREWKRAKQGVSDEGK